MRTSMSGRISAVVSDESHEAIKKLANQERRSLSQMTAILVEEALMMRLNPKLNNQAQALVPPTLTTPSTSPDTPTVKMPTTDKRKAK